MGSFFFHVVRRERIFLFRLRLFHVGRRHWDCGNSLVSVFVFAESHHREAGGRDTNSPHFSCCVARASS